MKSRWALFLISAVGSIGLLNSASLLDTYHYYINQALPAYLKEGIRCSSQEISQQKKLFGYDLAITHIIDTSATALKKPDRIKLFVHGFANNKNQALLFADRYQLLAGDFATFNLPDYAVGIPPFAPQLHKSSFGQLGDILPTLYAINYLRTTLNLLAIDLYGYSRGGATIVNMLAVLCDKNGTYDRMLERLGIGYAERDEIVEMIQKGSIVLHASMTDTNEIFNRRFKGALGKIFAKMAYDQQGLQPLKSAQSLNARHRFNVLLHFQANDENVLNYKEAELYNAFARHNPQHTYLVMGNDGGHRTHPKALTRSIGLFYKNVGAAYDYKKVTLYQKKQYTDLVQPSLNESGQYIASFHASCERQPKAKSWRDYLPKRP